MKQRKYPIAVLAFLLCGAAHATDYNFGQCPLLPNCNFASNPITTGSFADTALVYLGNWTESYGTEVYTSSATVQVSGPVSSCGRFRCSATIESATIDGTALVQQQDGSFALPINLSPGSHKFTMTGTATGGQYSKAHWVLNIAGVQYTLE